MKFFALFKNIPFSGDYNSSNTMMIFLQIDKRNDNFFFGSSVERQGLTLGDSNSMKRRFLGLPVSYIPNWRRKLRMDAKLFTIC